MGDDITIEFARRDDCLDRMVPSDLRRIVSERDRLRTALARAERERDQAWRLLQHSNDQIEKEQHQGAIWRERCQSAERLLREIDKRHLTRDMAEKVDAHLRDTGE